MDLFCVYWRRQHILRDSVMYRHDYSYSDYGISSSQMGEKVFYTINSSFVGMNPFEADQGTDLKNVLLLSVH